MRTALVMLPLLPHLLVFAEARAQAGEPWATRLATLAIRSPCSNAVRHSARHIFVAPKQLNARGRRAAYDA
jgi:hypothetical protein